MCVTSAFGERAGFDVDVSHIFPQDVLVIITLVGSVAYNRGARTCTGCEAGLPLCSVAITTLSGSSGNSASPSAMISLLGNS